MAAAPSTKWPGVSVTDGEKICTIFLKTQGLEVKKKHGLFGGLKAKDNADIKINITEEAVSAKVVIRDSSGEETIFEYEKKLPEPVDDKTSKWTIFKENRIKIELHKSKPGSWERRATYLQTRD